MSQQPELVDKFRPVLNAEWTDLSLDSEQLLVDSVLTDLIGQWAVDSSKWILSWQTLSDNDQTY